LLPDLSSSLNFISEMNWRLKRRKRPVLGSTQPLIQWVPGALYAMVKWPECDADYWLPSSAEYKNVWRCTSTSADAACTWKTFIFMWLVGHYSP
jgi:hypothetical protein